MYCRAFIAAWLSEQIDLHCCSGCRTNGPGYCQTRQALNTSQHISGNTQFYSWPPHHCSMSSKLGCA